MKMQTTGMMAVVSLCALAGVVQGQNLMHLDLNHVKVQVLDELGAATSTFGGENHNGALKFSIGDNTRLDVAVGNDLLSLGTPELQTLKSITGIDGLLELSGGGIITGYFTYTLSNDDVYTASVKPGSGQIEEKWSGTTFLGYEVSGITFDGWFTDANFDDQYGTVAAPELLGALTGLPGWFDEFLVDPNPTTGLSTANIEAYVMVPLPSAAYAGLGMLAGVMGLSYARRRR